MVHGHGIDDARTRLLYDDQAPRVRQPINATVLKFRRPSVLVLPLALILTAAVPTALAVAALMPSLPVPPQWLAGVLGSFFLLALSLALALAKREDESFALLLPNLLSASHLLLLLALIGTFVAAGPFQNTYVANLVTTFPGPAMGSFVLDLMKSYCILFVLITIASFISSLVFRVVGFRRVVAGEP